MKYFFLALLALLAFCPVPASAWRLLEFLNIKEPEDYVEIEVTVDESRCSDKEFPLLVKLRNEYNRNTKRITFDVTARQLDRSTSIYFTGTITQRYFETDYIIPQGDTYSACWPVPTGDLHDFCKWGEICQTGERRDRALTAKLEEYPLAEMVWSAEVTYVQYDD